MEATEKSVIYIQNGRTSGNALFSILHGYFPDSLFKIGVLDDKDYTYEDFLESARNAPLPLYMGHFWFGVHRHFSRPTEYFTTLRNPIERVLSSYNAWGRESPLSMAEWIKGNFDAQNGMVKRLCGYGLKRGGDPSAYDFNEDKEIPLDIQVTEADLAKALRNIDKHFSCVLFQEFFSEGLVLFGQIYQTPPLFSAIRQFYNNSEISLSAEQCPREIIDQFRESNIWDQKLYDTLRARFIGEIEAKDEKFKQAVRMMKHLTEVCSVRGKHTIDGTVFVSRLNAKIKSLMTEGKRGETVELYTLLLHNPRLKVEIGESVLGIVKKLGTKEDVEKAMEIFEGKQMKKCIFDR